MKAVFFHRWWPKRGRWWTKRDRLFGFLLCPADNGGQAVTVRVGTWTAHFEFLAWHEK